MSQLSYSSALKLYQNNQLAQAEQAFRELINTQPKFADAWHVLGIICYQTNRANEAKQHIAQALKLAPNNINYLNNYGLVLNANHQYEDALKVFQQAILLNPKDLDVQLNIANLLLKVKRFEEAAGYYRRLLRLQLKSPSLQTIEIRAALCHCLASLGNASHAAGQFKAAEACFAEAVQLNKQDAALFYNLANAQRELGKVSDAKINFEMAIALNPNDADAHNNLGNVQRELGLLDLAIKSYQTALQINPMLYHAKVHLVHQKQHIFDWENLTQDIEEIKHWVNTTPEAQVSPFAFLAMPGTTAQEQQKCANHWVKHRYQSYLTHKNLLNFSFNHDKSDVKNKLKIGYLSADFRLHPLAFLISELIELHDKNQFNITAYSYGQDDKTTTRARLVKAFDQFVDIRTFTDIEAANKIHADGIDILVDLTGFTQTSRTGIVALRPAPILVNWLGFPGTMGSVQDGNTHEKSPSTGLFDYLLTDRFISPEASSAFYSEKLAYLPDCYQANDRQRPVSMTPTRESCHLPADSFVFCCFNQTFKITPDIFAIWMRLLKAKPGSVLWLLACNPQAKYNLTQAALQHGVDASRLIYAPRVSIADHLARHAHANLFLDTLPYNAHTTCSDALWMGLPVLTCVGDTFSSRVAGSLLQSTTLSDLITYSLIDYEQKAMDLSHNLSMLDQYKQQLLAAKAHGDLFNTITFSKSLENLYKSMWQDYLRFK